jgi:DNA-directed RNA polymerase sigma subunit (sigma70/sigma32)
VSDTLEAQLGRRPTTEEIRVHFVSLGGTWVPSLQSIERAVGWSLSEHSYDEPPIGTHDSDRAEWRIDHTQPSEDDLIERIDGERQREALAAAMAQLEPDDRALLARRFGIGTRDAPTANKLRPNEAAALQRLREIMTGAKHQ